MELDLVSLWWRNAEWLVRVRRPCARGWRWPSEVDSQVLVRWTAFWRRLVENASGGERQRVGPLECGGNDPWQGSHFDLPHPSCAVCNSPRPISRRCEQSAAPPASMLGGGQPVCFGHVIFTRTTYTITCWPCSGVKSGVPRSVPILHNLGTNGLCFGRWGGLGDRLWIRLPVNMRTPDDPQWLTPTEWP